MMYANPPMLAADINTIIDQAIGLALDQLKVFLDSGVIAWLCKMFYDSAYFATAFASHVYNILVNKAYAILSTSPQEWAGSAWGTVKNLNDALMASLAIPLVTVFFLISFCKDSVDPHQDIRLENILRMFIKLSIASFFVSQSLTIVCWMFDIVHFFTENIDGAPVIASADSVAIALRNAYNANAAAGNWEIGPLFLILIGSFMFLIVSVCVAIMILYHALTRMFKIVALIPLGTLASSTLAGDRQIAQSASSFYKYALNCVLEAGVMMLCIVLFSKLGGSLPKLIWGTNINADAVTDYWEALELMLVQIVMMITLYGTVKGASELTRRALGL